MSELPIEFKEEIEKILPKEEYQNFLKSYEDIPRKGIRTNLLKLKPGELKRKLPESFKAEEIPWCSTGFYINAESRPGKRPEYYSGLYYPQEPSAMLPGEVLEVNEGDLVLDLCAAPGGKSTQLAAKLGKKGSLVFNEIINSRVRVLAENVERMGITNAVILNENPARLVKNFKETFDKILVDAPCSGEGMFRKDPKVIAEWTSERPERSSLRQKKILETVDQLLKPGGEVVYSTCTFSPEENELVISDFLDKHDYSIMDISEENIKKSNLNNIHVSDEILQKTVRIWPHLNNGEGHFVARLKKNGVILKERKRKSKQKNKNIQKATKKNLKDFLVFKNEFLPEFELDNLYIYKDKLIKLPEKINPDDLNGLKVYSAGLELGTFKKNRFEPSHSLAMSLRKNEFTNTYDLSEEELWDYLKGMEIKPKNSVKKGWVLMCYEGYPVGFGKSSNTIKNKYPKGLRIHKK